MLHHSALLIVILLLLPQNGNLHADEPLAWARHTIDATSRGADGARLADINGDGRPDIATGWEQGGIVRVYLHPGPDVVQQPWPAVTVGKVSAPEDAVFADLDGDGATDVVSCCEGRNPSVNVHWSPRSDETRLHPQQWQTDPLPASPSRRWMFAAPLDIDGQNGPDLLLGSKDKDARLGWLQAPPDPRRTGDWAWHSLCEVGWIMSIVPHDVDGDGDLDVAFSDRKGPKRGCYWLENPGTAEAARGPWNKRLIGGRDTEVMFLCVADLDADGLEDVLCAVRGGDIHYFRRTPPQWETLAIPLPSAAASTPTGTGKSVAVGDIDGDGKNDVVFSCENAKGTHGVMWLSWNTSPSDADWSAHPISGTAEGVKFDLVELLDLDADGDLDVLTCEEGDDLGVIWYENPTSGLE